MAHQIIITLSDDDYLSLNSQAKHHGTTVEIEAIQAVRHMLAAEPLVGTSPSADEILTRLHQEGFIENIATGEPLTPEDDAELERLAVLFSGGTMASDMIIEDRGPY